MKFGEAQLADDKNAVVTLIDLEIDSLRETVTRSGEELDLPPLSISLLKTLCAEPGKTYSQRELEQSLWPSSAVGPDVLKQRVRLLRKALGKTPDGRDYVLTKRGQGYQLIEPPVDKPKPSQRPRWKAIIALLLMAALAGLTYFLKSMGNSSLSVSVEPFTVSEELGEVSIEFARGLSMDLASKIASQPKLEALVSSGGQGEGDATLVGQVARNSERMHVTVQLIDTQTGKVIWGQTYDRAFSDIYDVQRDIALHISFMLYDQIDPEAAERLKSGPTDNYVAYSYFLKALGLRDTNTAEATLWLNQALELDPTFKAAEDLRQELSLE